MFLAPFVPEQEENTRLQRRIAELELEKELSESDARAEHEEILALLEKERATTDSWMQRCARLSAENESLRQTCNQASARCAELTEQNKFLVTHAHEDPLTGLPNLRMFQIEGERITAGVRRGKHRAFVMGIDADGLKSVNDTHGHAAGDELIRTIADVIRSSIRAEDVPARLGGDEYAVIIEAPVEGEPLLLATKTAERIRARVKEACVGDIRTTVSIGVAEITGDFTAARKNADQALYQAKEGGRDRIEVAE